MPHVPGHGALVHFTEETKIVTLLEPPVEGMPIVGLNLPDEWIATTVTMEAGEVDGQTYQYEIWVKL